MHTHQVVAAAILVFLLALYVPEDPSGYFLLVQETITTAVYLVESYLPRFVERSKDLPVSKLVIPLVFVIEPIGLFVLGLDWAHYNSVGADFAFVYPLLLTIKIAQCVAYGQTSFD